MKYGLILVFAIWISGCSTMTTKSGEDSEWGTPYSGLKTSPQNSYYYLNKYDSHIIMYVFTYIGAIIDFCASFAADTVLLPADGVVAIFDGDDEDEAESNESTSE